MAGSRPGVRLLQAKVAYMNDMAVLRITLLDSRFAKACNGTYRFYKVQESSRTYYAFGLDYDPLGNSNHIVYLDDDPGRSQAAWAKMLRKLEKSDGAARAMESAADPDMPEPV